MAPIKTLGLLGGMSWESTVLYYQLLNRRIRSVKGGHHSCPIILHSFDFQQIYDLQVSGDWDGAAKLLLDASHRLKDAGAEAIVICANTMHIQSEKIEPATGIPVIHIADATAAKIKESGHGKVALLGTRYTMEKEFLKGRLSEKHGLEVLVPEEADRKIVHDVIYEELAHGVIKKESKAEFKRIIEQMKEAGAECVILGCTEIPMLLEGEELALPAFDTTTIHAGAAADWAMSK
ncbi:aspartate racemase [Ascobolus immersus RN42]|uniref:Aspartate racemase n=1 Tax=Ascobolus immersus RN42 TaxID=1160509 RepID=A0A3N4IJT2_ASCIM|nr:aspartate racemase [Ascobolus immersus RN42]